MKRAPPALLIGLVAESTRAEGYSCGVVDEAVVGQKISSPHSAILYTPENNYFVLTAIDPLDFIVFQYRSFYDAKNRGRCKRRITAHWNDKATATRTRIRDYAFSGDIQRIRTNVQLWLVSSVYRWRYSPIEQINADRELVLSPELLIESPTFYRAENI